MKRVVVLASLAVLVLGCAEASKTQNGNPDSGVDPTIDAEVIAPDAAPDAPPGKPFWAECDRGEECASGICWRRNTSDPVGRCTQPCTRTCPDDFECKTVPYTPTIELDLCVPAEQTFCNPCSINRDCGDSSDLCIPLTAGRFCSIDCKDDPTLCPNGFTCQMLAAVGDVTNVWQCLPINGICCIDGDRDLHGRGGGCAGTDCDDTDMRIYDGAAEICDGVDNDCMGGVDVGQMSCKRGECSLGAFGYFERLTEPCTTGSCVPQNARDCGVYTCDGGGEVGDLCATSCDVEADTKCVPPAHCDASVCIMDLANGMACNENSDCISAHCQNGFCCGNGDCCQVASNCPTFGSFNPICEGPGTCQGTRGAALCANNECGTVNGVADDSACNATTEALTCGFYKSIYCSGAMAQTAPSCPSMCNSHADCDDNGFCDPITRTCREDLDDGQACGTEALRCKSNYCGNGFCCTGGDCCANENDCPASYRRAPSCDVPSACQGTRDIAQCVASRCTTSVAVPDDSACDMSIRASECGAWLPINCAGGGTQTSPVCPDSCTGSSQCDANAYCNPAGSCVPDEPNGGACRVDGDCQVGHCQNGFCCASGDCCATAANCTSYSTAAQCMTQATCQGTRVDGTCSAAFQCTTTTVQDDSACAGLLSSDCGPYPAFFCSAAMNQAMQPLCNSMCTSDSMCDVSAHCDLVAGSATLNRCVADQGPGGFCTVQNECGSGLTCVDGVCCTSSCGGTCRRCDVTGSVGTCTDVPANQDPDAECGAVDCSGYYLGWSVDSCRRRANVSASAARCAGTGSRCRTTAEECALSSTAGTTQITCNATCQDPRAGTCVGTTQGACNNVNPGTQTCGIGVCQVMPNICSGGAPLQCVPNSGAASPEVCDGVNNDCAGGIDDDPALADPKEPNNSCSAIWSLPEVGSDITLNAGFVNIYPSGDVDVFRIPMRETDNSCRGCNPFLGVSVDEDYRLYVTLSTPAGAGIYRFCLNNSCGLPASNRCVNVPAGSSNTLAYSFDGGCDPFGGSDSYNAYVWVDGTNASSFQCGGYGLSYTFDALICVGSPGWEDP
ncbi:MAG: putative metal-binding motif-containing protein [Deltaproteobacteria bacterium]|nr:putative metal-binding motif-containing protein [Deltaproteobacteria bacterium]